MTSNTAPGAPAAGRQLAAQVEGEGSREKPSMTGRADVERLRVLAEKARIEGLERWFADEAPTDEVLATDVSGAVTVVAKVNPMAEWNDEVGAAWTAYIAAAHPAQILSLLNDYAQLREEVEGLRADPPSISKDGSHAIGEHRQWLARQLLDSKLSDDEAYGIVRHSPAITGKEGKS